MIHLSSYHSNGLPTVVWSNKVNLIGEKVYKPKIHFCEQCNKPILIYGRLIPCKHVFCFSCATLCLTQQQSNSNIRTNSALSPPLTTNHLHRSDSNHSLSSRNDNNNGQSLINMDESTSNTTPTTIQQDPSIDSPNLNGNNASTALSSNNKGCHRCGGKALRVERNTLNSIFVCQIETCRRTYLSARDLQAHVNHRHSKNKSGHQASTSASLAAIASSPYISSSTLLHLNNSHSSSNDRHARHSNNSPHNHAPHRHDRSPRPHGRHGHRAGGDRSDRHRERDNYQRERGRDRDNKEYHRQSLQRAAQWAEASAQMMEKGLTR